MELTSPWEVLVDKGEKTFSDVGFDCLAIWWIEPYNIALSFAAFIPIIRFWGVEFQFMFVSVLYEDILIFTFSFIEHLLRRRERRKSCFYGDRQLFDDTWWMIRVGVDIIYFVTWFPVRFESPVV